MRALYRVTSMSPTGLSAGWWRIERSYGSSGGYVAIAQTDNRTEAERIMAALKVLDRQEARDAGR